jgi:hypothetical protein
MTVKFNKNNSDFQTAYFIAGAYHTADAAYIALLNQRQDREQVLSQVPVGTLRQQAARLRAERALASEDPAERLEGQATILEMNTHEAFNQQLIEAARAELAFIDLCILRLQPHRKYAHLSAAEAAEACQQEEWALELRRRAENYMLTGGTIPHDHFNTMRQHPDFDTKILPHIEQLHVGMSTPGGMLQVIRDSKPPQDLQFMLGLDHPSEAQTTAIQDDHV